MMNKDIGTKQSEWLNEITKNYLEKYKVYIDKRALEMIIALGENYVRLLQYKIIEFANQTRTNQEAYPIGEKEVMVFLEKEEKTKEKEPYEEFTYIDDKGKEKVSIQKITNYLLDKHKFKTTFNKKNESIFVFEDGIYKEKGNEIIKTQIEILLESKASIHVVNEVLEKIKRKTAIDKERFDTIPEELICLENGILNTKTKEFFDYNSKFYFKSKLPVHYNPKINCIEIKKFIGEIIYPEDIPVIQEWCGFILYKRYFVKKAIILFGETDTGKTVFLNLLMKFLGEKNTTGINLQRISSGDKFGLSSLKNKYANIFDDLSAKDLVDSGGFKIATGSGYITAEYKFGDSFQFLNYAKHIFATNKIPNVRDIEDDAYYNRWIPIPFDNKIEKNKRDSFILNKLTTKEELSGFLNWSLEGLRRLFKNGQFSYNKTSEEVKVIMQRQNNPLVAFVHDALEQENGNKITKEIMYRVYTIYCNKNKLPRMSKAQLGRSLEKYANYIIAKHSSKERYWENVKIKEEYQNIFATFISSGKNNQEGNRGEH